MHIITIVKNIYFKGDEIMLKKRSLIGLALTLVLSLGTLTGCGGSDNQKQSSTSSGEKITIRVGHVLAPTHPYTLGLQKFGEILSQKTNGRVTVEVFPSSQLGNERDMVEALQLGTQEMALVSTAPLSSFTKKFYVFDLPFIFKNTESARKVVDGEIGTELLQSLDEQGITGLCYFENGFRNITNNKGPINTPNDLKGLKIRTMESPIQMDTFTALGASPTPMAFGELFTALQQGTIDGQENPLAIIDTSKFYEVQKYLSITEHFYAPAPLLVSKSFFEGLDEETQNAIKEAALEARDYERGLLDESNAKLMDQLKKDGMEINTPDKAPFIEAVQSVYQKYENDITKELIEKVQKAQE